MGSEAGGGPLEGRGEVVSDMASSAILSTKESDRDKFRKAVSITEGW